MPTVSWKLFHAAVGAAVTVALAAALLTVSLLVAVLVTAAVVVAFAIAAAWVVHGSLAFAELRPAVLRWIVRGLTLAAAAHAAWIVTFHTATERWPLLLVILLGLAGAEYGIACATEYVLTRLRSRDESQPPRQLDRPEQVMAAALQRAGYGHLRIQSWEPIGGNDE